MQLLAYFNNIYKEGLCPSSGDINRLMMMILYFFIYWLSCSFRAFLVSCAFAHAGLTRIREISRCGWHAVSSFNFPRVAWQYWQSLVQYGACTPLDSKMDTEVVGTLTHADAPQRDNATHSTPHRAWVYRALYNNYTYENIPCGCYACGSIPRAWANPRDTKYALSTY
jgi:hypothetical protein